MNKINTHTFLLSKALASYISGEASDADKQLIDRWIAESDRNQEFFENIIQSSELPAVYAKYKAVDHRAAYKDFVVRRQRIIIQRRRTITRKIAKYVAVLMLPILMGTLWLINTPDTEIKYSSDTKINIPHGERKARLQLSNGRTVDLGDAKVALNESNGISIANKADEGLVYNNNGKSLNDSLIFNILDVETRGEFSMQLSDGTKVWLSSCTKLKYPVIFSDTERTVYLLDGEAFFDVSPDKSRPFRVVSNDFEVVALGTSFNVMNYSDEQFAHTTLASGCVEVSSATGKMTLTPGQQAYLASGQMEKRSVDVDMYTTWMQDKFRFNRESLDVVMRKLARWYGITVEYENDALRNYTFVGTLMKYEDIRETLKLLSGTAEIDFIVDSTKITVTNKRIK